MNRKTALASLAAFTAAFALVLSAVFAGGTSTTKIASAETLNSLRYVTLQGAVGTTATQVAGTAIESQYYGSVDCFASYITGTIVAGTVTQVTATVKLQNSIDGTNWADLTTYPAMITATSLLTRTPTYGRYLRSFITAGNTNSVTVQVLCKLVQTNQ